VLALAIWSAVLDAAPAAQAGDPEFRLLELGGRKVRWAVPENGLPAKITYAFLTERAEFPGARNCDAMLPPEAALERSKIGLDDFRREVRAAFSVWQQAANIEFQETHDVAAAGILIGADAKARGRAFTNVALRQDTVTLRKDGPAGDSTASLGAIGQSLICLNPKQPWKIGFDGDLDVYDVRFTVTHEIGHAIGLDHPSPEGQLMSFRYVERARGLQPGDVAGIAALYGRRGAPAAPLPDTLPAPARAAGAQGAPDERVFGLGEGSPVRPR
jgi:hypothetical protein